MRNLADACEVFFAGNVDYDGFSYYLIYGKHINGGFVALPRDGISAEQSLNDDRGYNVGKLTDAGMDEGTAGAIVDFCADWKNQNKPDTKINFRGIYGK